MPIPAEFTFVQLNTQIVELDGLTDAVTGAFINGNTSLLCKLVNSKKQVDPIFNNIQLNYVANSNGNYRAVVPGTFDAPVGSGYKLFVDGNNGSSIIHLEIPAIVTTRKT